MSIVNPWLSLTAWWFFIISTIPDFSYLPHHHNITASWLLLDTSSMLLLHRTLHPRSTYMPKPVEIEKDDGEKKDEKKKDEEKKDENKDDDEKKDGSDAATASAGASKEHRRWY